LRYSDTDSIFISVRLKSGVVVRNIIGRASELKELEEVFESKVAELVAVYGRRRVGKTFLIKTFFQAKQCVYFQMTGIYKGTLKNQLTRFSKELGETFYNGASMKVPVSWMDAFDELTKTRATVKCCVRDAIH